MTNTKAKCKTCWGFGLWPDSTAPMGPMDASDGLPTIACPECRVNPNPATKAGHAPIPWEAGPYDSRGVPIYSGPGNQDEVVAYVEDMSDSDTEANATFIVQACNNFEALLATCKALSAPQYSGGYCPWCGQRQAQGRDDLPHAPECPMPKAQALIAQIEQEETP